MTETKNFSIDTTALQAALAEREQLVNDYLGRERDLLEQAFADKASRTAQWEGTITSIQRSAHADQLGSYQSLAHSLGGLLGLSIREQAKVMVPFEVAEATKEFARFLGTKYPGALASSLKHLLAAKQYATAAKSGAPGGSGGGGGGGGGGKQAAPTAAAKEEAPRQTRVVVNVGRQVGVVDTYAFARNLIDAINENLRDDVVLEVTS